MATEVKKADCGHWVKANKEAKYYVETESLAHTELGVKVVKGKDSIVLCESCEKQI